MKPTTLFAITFILISGTAFSQEKSNTTELNKVISFTKIENYNTVKTSGINKFNKRTIRVRCFSDENALLLRKKIKVYKSGIKMERFIYADNDVKVKGLKINDAVRHFYWYKKKGGLPVKYIN